MLTVQKASGKVPGATGRGRPTENKLPDDFVLELGEYGSLEFETPIKANTAQRVIVRQFEQRGLSDYRAVRRTQNGKHMLFLYREATATVETPAKTEPVVETPVTDAEPTTVTVEVPTATVTVTVTPTEEISPTADPVAEAAKESVVVASESPVEAAKTEEADAPLTSTNPRKPKTAGKAA